MLQLWLERINVFLYLFLMMLSGYKLRLLPFVRGSSWNRILRVDVHRAVKMLCRKVEYVSLPIPPPPSVRLATEFVSSYLFLLSSFWSYSHLCKIEPPLPAPSWVWLQISKMTFPIAVGPPFWLIVLSLWKPPWNISILILCLWDHEIFKVYFWVLLDSLHLSCGRFCLFF